MSANIIIYREYADVSANIKLYIENMQMCLLMVLLLFVFEPLSARPKTYLIITKDSLEVKFDEKVK